MVTFLKSSTDKESVTDVEYFLITLQLQSEQVGQAISRGILSVRNHSNPEGHFETIKRKNENGQRAFHRLFVSSIPEKPKLLGRARLDSSCHRY